MNLKVPWIALTVLLQSAAYAQPSQRRQNPATLESIVVTVLPILVVAAIVYFFIIRTNRKNADTSKEYIRRHEQHMDRIEQSLDRIASALEKNKPL